MHGAPLNYLTGYGFRANQIAWLTWGLIAVSLIVIAVVVALLVAGITRRRTISTPDSPYPPAARPAPALEWVYIGVAISAVVLFGSAVWTMFTLAAVGGMPESAALTVAITGHQWWWEAQYLSTSPSEVFTTANEIHIPIGKPIRFLLTSADVIHSFWVPALAGKTDVIPGQTNSTWLEAAKPGTYLGQCAEYCGTQHAHMALRVVADPADRFEAWRKHEIASTPKTSSAEIANGEAVFTARCGGCHRVRGTLAGGVLGPDLTHLMSRGTIAAGTVPNTPAYLSAWIIDPQTIKPGTQMPAVDLSGPELQAIRTFLQSLS
jgi:cytochrome c oxidase subunit II